MSRERDLVEEDSTKHETTKRDAATMRGSQVEIDRHPPSVCTIRHRDKESTCRYVKNAYNTSRVWYHRHVDKDIIVHVS